MSRVGVCLDKEYCVVFSCSICVPVGLIVRKPRLFHARSLTYASHRNHGTTPTDMDGCWSELFRADNRS